MTTIHTQTCNRCHHTAPLVELDLFHGIGDIDVECKDRAACRCRAEVWNAENWVSDEGHDMRCESEFDHTVWKWLPCDCSLRADERAEAGQ
jgi:hypothetical protein